MSKGIYRSVEVKDVDLAALEEAVRGQRVVVGTDVGKHDFRASITTGDREVHVILAWEAGPQMREALDLLTELPADSVEVVVEPTGTYGDPFVHQVQSRGLPVYRVSAKRVHDAKEVYDGVPSTHDAKAACTIARLHLDGGTHPWRIQEGAERDLSAQVRLLSHYEQQEQKLLQKLEALLARHWPEVTGILKLTSRTLPELLAALGGPARVAAEPRAGRELMHRISRRRLAPAKIAAILRSARETLGIPMTIVEQQVVSELCREMLRMRDRARRVQDEVESLVEENEAVASMASTVGKKTAAVLMAECGDPRRLPHAGAFEKTLGLNLKEESSGTYRGQLRITKRGSGVARWYLFLAVLRLIRRDAVVRAWYERKVQRDGGRLKLKALVAVMRKLARALWHVARGEPFDSRKLFDTRKLHLA